MKKTTSLWAAGGLLFTALIWGLAFVVVKNSLDFVPPIYMMAFRFTIATAGLSLMFIGRLKNIDAAMLKSGFVLGFLLTIAYALQTIGCKYTTAGKNAFLTAAYVVFVPFLHWMVNNQKTKKSHIAAAFVAIIGIALLSLQDVGKYRGLLVAAVRNRLWGTNRFYREVYQKTGPHSSHSNTAGSCIHTFMDGCTVF